MKRIYLMFALLIVGATACGGNGGSAVKDPPIPVISSEERGWHDATGKVKTETLETLRVESTAIHEAGQRDGKGYQVAGIFVNDIASEPSQYAADVGNKNGIGSEENDNGILILVMLDREAKDGHKPAIFVATGRGAEGDFPDSKVTEFREKYFNPLRADGKWEQGLIDLTHELGEFFGDPEHHALSSSSGSEVLFWFLVIGGIIVVIFLLIFFIPGGPIGRGSGYYSSGSGWSSGSSSSSGFGGGGGSFGGGGSGD